MALPPNLQSPGLFQSAASFAANRLSRRFSPEAAAEAGRAVGAVQSLYELLSGDARFNQTPMPLLGGITMDQAKILFKQCQDIQHARKNFYFIEVFPLNGDDGVETYSNESTAGAYRVRPQQRPNVNMFALDVSYTPISIASDQKRVGAVSLDDLQAADRVELEITTLDNSAGSLKKWFEYRSSLVADRVRGTFGVPATYGLRFIIHHAVVDGYLNNPRENEPYVQHYVMRPTSIRFELSRRDPGMQELQMTFTELDTCMPTELRA